jgi:iron complex outermembrane receptor protein
VFHSGTVYYDFANYFKQTPYTMLSGEISWTLKHPNLKFSIFGTNLTDAKVAQLIRPGALDTDLFYEHPRKIGAGVEFNF